MVIKAGRLRELHLPCWPPHMRKIDLTNFQVATSETARDINRRIVLNLIRSHQPISRADLARHSGLQRSTVSVITEQLIRERWVREGANGHTPRGRRPRFLHLNKERVAIIGIDVRPAKTTVALADLDGHLVAQLSLPTNPDPQVFIRDLIPHLLKLINLRPEITCEGIGVSLPGRVDLATHRLLFAPNLGWRNFDLKAPLESETGLPVELENAANACAMAETWFGNHAEGVHNLVAVTVSEGIGTGMILNHQLVRGSTGLAGEFGHFTIIEGGLECRCGNQGCWEMYASNSAAVRYYYASTPDRPTNRSIQDREDEGRSITFEDVLTLAQHGDQRAEEAIQTMGHYLGVGLAMIIVGLAPDIIVVVGEVTRVWNLIGPVIEETVSRHSITHAATRIVPTNAITQPRLLGTIALVLEKHFGAPLVA
jgi:predicted NBD/HSP70 family sugar kinase